MKIRVAIVIAALSVAVAALMWLPVPAAIAFAWVRPNYQDIRIGSAMARIYFPGSFRNGDKGRRALLYMHGNGRDHTLFLGMRALQQIRDGEDIVAIIDGQGATVDPYSGSASGWGNATYQERYLSLYSFLRKKYDIAADVDLIGESMGGLSMGRFIVSRPFPIARVFGIGLVPSLQTVFDHGGEKRRAPIRQAFGMRPDGEDDALLKRIAHDAFWVEDLAGHAADLPPLRIVAGSSDDVFKIEFGGSEAYRKLCADYVRNGGQCAFRIYEGPGHGDNVMLPDLLSEALLPPPASARKTATQRKLFATLTLAKTCRLPCRPGVAGDDKAF